MNCEGWSSGEAKLGWADRATGGSGMGLARSSNEAGFGYTIADGGVGLSHVGVGSGVTVSPLPFFSFLFFFFPSF